VLLFARLGIGFRIRAGGSRRSGWKSERIVAAMAATTNLKRNGIMLRNIFKENRKTNDGAHNFEHNSQTGIRNFGHEVENVRRGKHFASEKVDTLAVKTPERPQVTSRPGILRMRQATCCAIRRKDETGERKQAKEKEE
jgi:hypothetical protein